MCNQETTSTHVCCKKNSRNNIPDRDEMKGVHSHKEYVPIKEDDEVQTHFESPIPLESLNISLVGVYPVHPPDLIHHRYQPIRDPYVGPLQFKYESHYESNHHHKRKHQIVVPGSKCWMCFNLIPFHRYNTVNIR